MNKILLIGLIISLVIISGIIVGFFIKRKVDLVT
jgi:hypothetical protein